MNVRLSLQAIKQLTAAPIPVRKAFIKQTDFLVEDLKHPSLHAKKYGESKDLWQARVNKKWRFYFVIKGDTYEILNIIIHPK